MAEKVEGLLPFEIDKPRILHPLFIERLKNVPETQFVDVKSKEIAPGKLSRSISAFCNTDGGVLIIGIEEAGDKRTWNGFTKPEDANGVLQLMHELFPLNNPITANFYSAQDQKGLILILEMAKTAQVVKSSDGKIYVRRGAANQPVITPEQIKQLELTKGVSSHEDATIRDDIATIRGADVFNKFMDAMVPNADREVWLKKQRLEVGGLPTVAAELLFSDEPQIVLPKSAIKIYRYKTTDAEGTRDTLEFQPLTIEGCAYDLIAKSGLHPVRLTPA